MTTASTTEHKQSLTKHWLVLAVFMLALSGIFSLIIVFARTPGLYNIPYVQKLFHEALVIHVDLLVVGWPLCIAGMMWAAFCPSHLAPNNQKRINTLGMGAIVLGALMLVSAPLDFAAEPLKNNYIPVITADIFILGLMLIGAGAAWLSLHAVFLNRRDAMADVSLAATYNWGARGIGIIVLFGLASIYMAFSQTDPALAGSAEHYYEVGFWAGGHIFQYAFTQLAMLAWLWVFTHISNYEYSSYKIVRAILLLNVLIGSVGIYGILAHDTLSFEYNRFYTMHMIIGGGIAPMLFLCWVLYATIRKPAATSELHIASKQDTTWPPAPTQITSYTFLRPTLIVSIALFLYGGFLGLLIQGQDVTIPAHYHGSTISVTIALMGFAYAFMPRIIQRPIPVRLIKWQPIIYGGGQFLHITGLAISGGYGALRKTPGVEGTANAKIAMGVMGMGGLLAVIGGLMFVYIMWVCLRRRTTTN